MVVEGLASGGALLLVDCNETGILFEMMVGIASRVEIFERNRVAAVLGDIWVEDWWWRMPRIWLREGY